MTAAVLIIWGVLGQNPHMGSPTIAEIRMQLNRFDDWDKASLEAKAKSLASQLAKEDNEVRRRHIQEELQKWILINFDHVKLPLRAAEGATLENITEEAAKYCDHDNLSPPQPLPLPQPPAFNPQKERTWYEVIFKGVRLKVWGLKTDSNTIKWFPNEQSEEVKQTYIRLKLSQKERFNIQDRRVYVWKDPENPNLIRYYSSEQPAPPIINPPTMWYGPPNASSNMFTTTAQSAFISPMTSPAFPCLSPT